MISNWIHIIIVHFSVIGTPWLLYQVLKYRKFAMDSKPWKITFSGLIILTVLTAIAYFTGPETAEWTKQVLISFPQEHVENHGLWGRIAFVIQVLSGLIGIMGWASILQEEKPARFIPNLVIILLVINTIVLFYTAHLGGLTRRMDILL